MKKRADQTHSKDDAHSLGVRPADMDRPPESGTQPDGGIEFAAHEPASSLADEAGEAQLTVEARLEKCKRALAESQKRELIAVADLENFRKRNIKQTQEQIKFASAPLMTDILDSLDNLRRAIETHDAVATDHGLLAGVKMVAAQIEGHLENHGCKKIDAVGHPFDANLHQAVQMLNSTAHPPNTVISELRSGYVLHDRVLRPAQVVVSIETATQ
jgi:molecular chaperone GrpE